LLDDVGRSDATPTQLSELAFGANVHIRPTVLQSFSQPFAIPVFREANRFIAVRGPFTHRAACENSSSRFLPY
ncbi:MAG: hypothetical protein N2C14_15535, partial [Planctomycetales bacterium]